MKSPPNAAPSLSPVMSSLLNRHFATCSAAAACVTGVVVSSPNQAEGAIVYSGLKNFTLPATGQLYINLVSGATASAAAGLTDWDMAPYGGGLSNQPSYSATTVLLGAASANLAPGTLIDSSANFSAATGGVPAVAIPENTTGIIGFKFNPASINGFTPAPNGTPTNYGWFRMTTGTAAAGGGTVVDWAYESVPETGIIAGAVPEPSSLACLALGAVGLSTLRRRKAALAA